MGQVTITLNGRSYRLRCGPGEEPRLIELADEVRAKLDGLISEFGQAGDDRLLLMSALLIADELHDARARLAALAAQPSQTPEPMLGPPALPTTADPRDDQPEQEFTPTRNDRPQERYRGRGGAAVGEQRPMPRAAGHRAVE